VINNGVNQCRAVIALTDGGDNASTRTVAEIISLANRHRIRVFTIGLGSGINATELEQIALLTGGRYYQTPNAASWRRSTRRSRRSSSRASRSA
jgi:copper homeostasis protein CutC